MNDSRHKSLKFEDKNFVIPDGQAVHPGDVIRRMNGFHRAAPSAMTEHKDSPEQSVFLQKFANPLLERKKILAQFQRLRRIRPRVSRPCEKVSPERAFVLAKVQFIQKRIPCWILVTVDRRGLRGALERAAKYGVKIP